MARDTPPSTRSTTTSGGGPRRDWETHGEWQDLAENTLKDFAARGLFGTKVTVDTEEPLHWCNERDLKVNGESRSQYASRLLQEKDKADSA